MTHLHRLIRHHETTLLKTSCYYVLHVIVAAGVTLAVTGDWHAAVALSLLEPSIQALAYFVHEILWRQFHPPRYRALLKTMTYYAMHLAVAASVAYAVTGDFIMALTLSLLEPTVQMFSFYLHEKFWEHKLQRRHQCPQEGAVQHMHA